MDFPNLLPIYNWLGDIAFCVGGVLAAKFVVKKRYIWILSGIATTFLGGAILRDLIMLNTIPSILSSPQELIAMTLLAVLATLVFPQLDQLPTPNSGKSVATLISFILVAIDSIGILAFSAIAYDRGIIASGSLVTAIACGWCTACGGGLFAAIFRSAAKNGSLTARLDDFSDTVSKNIPYYRFGFATTITYTFLSIAGVDRNVTLAFMTIPVLILGYLTNREMTVRGCH